VGPDLQRRPVKLIQHGPPSKGNSTPLKRIAGYRAPLTPRLARPRRDVAEGAGFEPAAQGSPVHGISSAAPSAARSPLHHRAHREKLAEGRGFEPPRDLLGPYPISSRTPSTGLGHPSARISSVTLPRYTTRHDAATLSAEAPSKSRPSSTARRRHKPLDRSSHVVRREVGIPLDHCRGTPTAERSRGPHRVGSIPFHPPRARARPRSESS
jgi:hypothetical protein